MKKLTLVLAVLALCLMAQQAALAASASVDKAEETILAYGDADLWDEQGNPVTPSLDVPKETIADPLEGWNRVWYTVNDKLYFYLVKPLAQGYGYVVPEPARKSVSNAVHNALFPVRFVNCLLQGKFREAGVEFGRFWVNTTVGIGGLADVTANDKPTQPIGSTEQDFGLTLGNWGAGHGFYLVWPVIGPSSLRDSVGYAGDYYLDAASWVHPWWKSVAIKSYERLNEVSQRIGDYEDMKAGAVDPYSALKDAYIQYRKRKLAE